VIRIASVSFLSRNSSHARFACCCCYVLNIVTVIFPKCLQSNFSSDHIVGKMQTTLLCCCNDTLAVAYLNAEVNEEPFMKLEFSTVMRYM